MEGWMEVIGGRVGRRKEGVFRRPSAEDCEKLNTPRHYWWEREHCYSEIDRALPPVE
eukprot:gene41438-16700_t